MIDLLDLDPPGRFIKAAILEKKWREQEEEREEIEAFKANRIADILTDTLTEELDEIDKAEAHKRSPEQLKRRAKGFFEFMAQPPYRMKPLPAAPAMLAIYVLHAHISENAKLRDVSRRVEAIDELHALSGHAKPGDSALVRAALKRCAWIDALKKEMQCTTAEEAFRRAKGEQNGAN